MFVCISLHKNTLELLTSIDPLLTDTVYMCSTQLIWSIYLLIPNKYQPIFLFFQMIRRVMVTDGLWAYWYSSLHYFHDPVRVHTAILYDSEAAYLCHYFLVAVLLWDSGEAFHKQRQGEGNTSASSAVLYPTLLNKVHISDRLQGN